MKMKTLAMLAASGLMAASLAYVVPAYADDENMELAMNDQPMTLADNGDNSSMGMPQPDSGTMSQGATGGAAEAGNANSANSANSASNTSNAANANSNAINGSTTTASNTNASNASNTNNANTQNNDQGTPDVASGDDDY